MKLFFILLSLDLCLPPVTLALGQDTQSRPNSSASDDGSFKRKIQTDAKGRRITVINFDDANIEGKAKAPDGFLLQSRAAGGTKSILELRRNFRPQIDSSQLEAFSTSSTGL